MAPDGADLVLAAFATWRLALFLTDDRGPWDLASNIRHWLHTNPMEHNWSPAQPLTGWEQLWSCLRCMTLWTALLVGGLYAIDPRLILLPGVWGAATALDMVTRRE